MRISIVTDIHGNIDALARVAYQAEQLIILGDLLDYVDYHDPSRGIIGEVFGVDAATTFTRIRARGDFIALRELNTSLWSTIADPVETVRGIVRARYDAIRAVLPAGTLITLGNVDVAAEWTAVAGDEFPYRDAEVVAIDGIRFGFVAGGVRRARGPVLPVSAAPHRVPWQPFIRDRDDYLGSVNTLGPVDVLCSHIPPDVAALRYDVIPARLEMAGPGLTEYIDREEPLYSLFGHVHQPLAARMRLGRTECVNAGHFQRSERAFLLDTDVLHAMVAERRGVGTLRP